MQLTQDVRVRAVVLAAVLTTSAGCAAQSQVQPQAVARSAPPPVAAEGPPSVMGSPPPPPVGAPGPLADAASVANMQVTVARFLINPDGDVDSLMTDDGTLVRIPPHMGSQLTSTVRKGDSVQVNGTRDPGGTIAAQRITVARNGWQWINEPPSPGTLPMPRGVRGEALARLSAQGQVAHVTTAPRGEPDGVILSDGTVIKLTPPVAEQFAALVRTGATVSAQGYGTRNQYGTALQATAFGAPGNLIPLYDRDPRTP